MAKARQDHEQVAGPLLLTRAERLRNMDILRQQRERMALEPPPPDADDSVACPWKYGWRRMKGQHHPSPKPYKK